MYARNLLAGLAALEPAAEFLAYVSTEEARFAVPAGVETRLISGNPFLRLGFDFAMKLRQDRPDLLHVQYTAPLGCPVPVIASVHDVSFMERPEYFPRARAFQLRCTVGRTVRGAARILTGTEFSRASILKAYPDLDPDKIVVVPDAASSAFRPVSREGALCAVRDKFGFAEPFVLSVGDLQPRKNQIGLIRGFARMIRSNSRVQHHLVLAGKPTWFSGEVERAASASGAAGRIHFTGFITDEDLLQLYNACDLFVFPSFYEGFGIPVLEAMACGRAVACSSTSAMPEVADGAAILFDPYSDDEIARAMVDLIADAHLRARMERLGLQRASQFSWQKTAERTFAVYSAVAERRPAGKELRPAAASGR